MSTWDKRYTGRVQLLVDILPVLAKEPRFALKGGTAINLFEHDLPRLSVDIDLTWLPMQDYAADADQIEVALTQLADVLRARPWRLQVQSSAGEGGRVMTRLLYCRRFLLMIVFSLWDNQRLTPGPKSGDHFTAGKPPASRLVGKAM
jgi:hypothetical protein